MIYTHIGIVGFYVKTAIIRQLKRLCVPDCTYMESMFINFIHFIQVCTVFLLCRPFYINSNETPLYERDSDASNVCSEPGGK